MVRYKHIPVMLKEVLNFLEIKKGANYIDATLGGGGYTKAITEMSSEKSVILSIDLDPLAINNFLQYKKENNIIVNDNFSNLKNIVFESLGENYKFDGIVADLGISSAQLDDISRGFSFNNNKSLEMSFGPKIENSTFWIVNNYKQFELENVIKRYGEEPWAKKIAERIVSSRKKKRIENSVELANIISLTIPKKFWSKSINPATKTFQALRMETNLEIDNLEKFLKDAFDLLKVGGRLVIVSFHSLEDRTVKLFFREKKMEGTGLIITKKPFKASENELRDNNRSRSAKLRVIEKIVPNK